VSHNRRTFPRIPVSEPGLLEFTPPWLQREVKASARQPQRLTVMVASAACEGLRLYHPQPIHGLAPGMRIHVRFHVGNQPVALPGEVAWLATSGAGGSTNVGVALALELAAAADRRRWAEWIVDQTRQSPESARASEVSTGTTRPRG
jgi:PilZ domain-containing protein